MQLIMSVMDGHHETMHADLGLVTQHGRGPHCDCSLPCIEDCQGHRSPDLCGHLGDCGLLGYISWNGLICVLKEQRVLDRHLRSQAHQAALVG